MNALRVRLDELPELPVVGDRVHLIRLLSARQPQSSRRQVTATRFGWRPDPNSRTTPLGPGPAWRTTGPASTLRICSICSSASIVSTPRGRVPQVMVLRAGTDSVWLLLVGWPSHTVVTFKRAIARPGARPLKSYCHTVPAPLSSTPRDIVRCEVPPRSGARYRQSHSRRRLVTSRTGGIRESLRPLRVAQPRAEVIQDFLRNRNVS